MPGRRAIVVCETLRREAEAALAGTAHEGTQVLCFAARCEGAVELPAALEEKARGGELSLHVLGGSCLRKLADGAASGAVPCKVSSEEQCFQLVARPALVEALQADGAYLVTPGWVLRYRERLAAQGLEGGQGRELFREGLEKLVLLDLGQRPEAQAQFEQMGRELGLPAVRLPVSLDRLRERLLRALDPPEEPLPPQLAGKLEEAEYVMALELLGDLSLLETPEAVLRRAAEVCAQLVSPKSVAAWSAVGGHLRLVSVSPPEEAPGEPQPLPPASRGTRTQTGLVVPVRDGRELRGLLAVEQVLLPERIDDYLQVCRFVSVAAGLSLRNLGSARHRADGELACICAYCKDVRDGERWMRVEEFLLPRLSLRFSHGICPRCFAEQYRDFDAAGPWQ
jgi:Protein of unknown function (DUF1638)